MRSGIFRGVIIIGFIVLAAFILAPTHKWYYKLSDQDKGLTNIPKKDIKKKTEKIEANIDYIRKAIGDSDYYKLAGESDKDIVLDIGLNAKEYAFRIPQKKLEVVVKKLNSSFTEFDRLKEAHKESLEGLTELARIKELKKFRKTVIKLGLDLAGGVHFVIDVDVEELRKRISQKFENQIKDENIKKLILQDKEFKGNIEEEIKKRKANIIKERDNLIDDAQAKGYKQLLLKIRNRVDQFGVAEPIIRTNSQGMIIVELPGAKEKESAKEIIIKEGKLALHLVNEKYLDTLLQAINKGEKKVRVVLGEKRIAHITDLDFINKEGQSADFPSNTMFFPLQVNDKYGMKKVVGYIPLYKKEELTGDKIVNAKADFGQFGDVTVGFTLDSEGATIFSKVTGDNVNKRMAIVLDGSIMSAPNISQKINLGRAQITGKFSSEEAKGLAAILRAGSLPIPVVIEEERVVGASLGEDQIQKGVISALVALGVLFLFILVYYRWSGLVINFAQILNLFFIFAVMAQLGATLTLPGIAGIVLTIGMCVDANVIISERIKEELREGRSLESAINHGYQSAFRTILDSNVTTLFAAIILALVGTGPIKGFGVTLIIGLIMNIFTAIFVTRYIYDLFIYKFGVKGLSLGGGKK